MPTTPLASPEAALGLAGSLQDAYFEPAPAFLTDDCPVDYSYNVDLNQDGMRVTVSSYRLAESPVLMYEEIYRTMDGELWRRTLAYNEDILR